MDSVYGSPHKTYIKSNTATVVRFLWCASVLLLVLVAGFCVFVVLGRDDTNQYHWDATNHFYYTLQDDQATIVKYVNRDAESCVVPANVNYGGQSYPVTVIEKQAFTNHRKLKSVEIPDTVTDIMCDDENQTGAFSGCIALTAVNLGQGVVRIGNYVFKNCIMLNQIEFPSSVQFVGDSAFQGCLALQSITLNSNGILGSDCFADCLNVDTLQLANDVILTDDTREVLSGLTHLSHFIIPVNHTDYMVQTVGDGDCLLTTIDTPNDTIVLGGYGAEVPAGVVQICDWAWGERASTNFFVPSSVNQIGANSFQCSSICTDAESKPLGWLTEIQVYPQAELTTFQTGDGMHETQAYVYYDGQKEVYPEYEDLFPDVSSETPFKDWIKSGTIYVATYQEAATNFVALTEALENAVGYIDDAETRLKFTFDFWEKFKMHYYRAQSVSANPSETYQSEVDELSELLDSDISKIEAVVNHSVDIDETIFASTDWHIGLQNLIDNVKALKRIDLAEGLDDASVRNKVKEAELFVSNHETITSENGNREWKELRDLFETLEVNVGVNSELQKEINACENLRRENYTKASWQKLQNQLQLAKQMSTHNLSISVVRENLSDARAVLREVTLHDDMVRLNTWLSICSDLPLADYQSREYDRLLFEIWNVVGNAENLINHVTVDSAISNLQNRYTNLVPLNNTSAYQKSTGILNKKSLPYFITVVILFTGAVACGAAAASLKRQLNQSKE